jgi:Domain of unknown function (DUF6475)
MRPEDAFQFALWMTALGELYGKNISTTLNEIYWNILKNFDFQQVERAFHYHITNPDGGQFMPKPADIVRIIQGTAEEKSLDAWTQVEKAIRRIGSYDSVSFDDALIHAVIDDMGGWIALCATKLTEMPFRANEFQKRYLCYLAAQPAETVNPVLSGIIEHHNRPIGFPAPQPKKITREQRTINAALTALHDTHFLMERA